MSLPRNLRLMAGKDYSGEEPGTRNPILFSYLKYILIYKCMTDNAERH